MKDLRSFFRFPYLPVWMAGLILLAPVYLAGKALFWGTPLLQFVPWWRFAWDTLLSGHLPLWNPLVGMGAPLMANYQSGLLYPPYYIHLLIYAIGGVKWMAWGMAVVAAFHLAWAGLGTALLVRRLGLGALAQAVSGLAFGLSGYLVARLGFMSINAAAAWLPWILLCLTPLPGGGARSRSEFSWLVACLAMLLLAGHAQTAWYILLLGALWTAFWTWNSPSVNGAETDRGWTNKFRDFSRGEIWFGLALLLAAGIAAAQLLPTAEYLAQSQRATAVEFEYALNYSFWPWHLLTLLAPGLFGSPVSGDYWGYANIWEDAVYVGLLPLLLAFSALLRGLKQQAEERGNRRLAWLMALIFALALLLALGKNTPVFPFLYRNIPTFDMFQAPARWMIWAEFAIAILAGLGADRWRAPRGWGLYWTRLGTMGAVAVSLGAGLTWIYLGSVSPSFIRATAILGLLGVGVGVLSLSAPPVEAETVLDRQVALHTADMKPSGPIEAKSAGKSKLRRMLLQLSPPPVRIRDPQKPYPLRLWQWAVTGFVALDLLAAGWGLNPGVLLRLFDPSPTASLVQELAGENRLYLSGAQEEWLKYVRFLRFDTFHTGEDWQNLRAVMLPNTHMLDGIAATNNFDPFVPGRYVDWLDMLAAARPEAQAKLLRLMGVGVIETLDRAQPYGVRFQEIDGNRLHWLPCARLADDPDEARTLVFSEEVDLTGQVVLEGLKMLPADDCQKTQLSIETHDPQVLETTDPSSKPSSWTARSSNPNRIELDVVATAPGWLMISDTWYPGWRAWVDGEPAPLLRANYLFRALHLIEGDHRVVIAYRPISFYAGLALSLLSIAISGFLWTRKPSQNLPS